jgi:hypothetical protein
MENELAAHLGGNVTVPQRILINRLSVDLLRLELLDSEVGMCALTERDVRTSQMLRNSVRLALRDLGLEAVAAPAPTSPSPIESFRQPVTQETAREAYFRLLKAGT